MLRRRFSRASPVILAAVACLGFGLVHAEPAKKEAEVVFKTKVSSLGQSDSPLTKGKQKDDPVEVVLPGVLHNPPRKEAVIAKAAADWSEPEKGAITDHSSYIADDLDWILKCWVAEEQAEIKRMMEDKDIRKRNREQLAKSKGLAIWGTVRYKEYAIVLCKDDGDPKAMGLPLTFKKTADGWKRTNALSSDETIHVLFSAFNEGGVSKK